MIFTPPDPANQQANPDIERIHPRHPLHLERSTVTPATSSPAPVVILLGWTNSQLKHLSRGAAYYRARGFNIVYYHASDRLIFNTSLGIQIATALIPTLDSLGILYTPATSTSTETAVQSLPIPSSQHTSPLVVHVFSNGGCLGLWALFRALHARNLRLRNLRAIIFDSCPGFSSFWALPKTLSAGIRSPVRRALTLTLVTVGAVLLFLPYWLYIRVVGSTSFVGAVQDIMSNEEVNSVPRLFLYSTKDDLVSYAKIEEFADQAEALSDRAKGGEGGRVATVRRVRFEETAHVQHWIDERSKEVYWQAISNVI
ncbi:hypothetical protein BC938DRAFT_484115 [Jimgerdemannia flammicorona]|uniref:Indole-diterpene biosynthesis protein PaxU n=1 Tax=Jimgerdemannia flammicorona TaxID=994334 RepID=A0A433QAE8_9FUNG|nr:hypothetical protein BC938DRAFT_484115 [Jimgerdemannia flammicorona]